jgi:hypothetical protein
MEKIYIKKMNLHVWTKYTLHLSKIYVNHIGGVMVSVLASSAVDRGFQIRSGQNQKL